MRLLIYIVLLLTCIDAGAQAFAHSQGFFKTKGGEIPIPEIAYYKFEGNTADSSGNGYHLTNSGATLDTNKAGTSNWGYKFDGINDYMYVTGGEINCDTVHSFVWRQRTLSGMWGYIFMQRGNANNRIYCPTQLATQYRSDLDPLSQVNLTHTTNVSTPLAYYDWVITRSGDTLKLYINGSLQDTETLTQNEDFYFYQIANSTELQMESLVDFLYIYNRVITQEEIDAIKDNDDL